MIINIIEWNRNIGDSEGVIKECRNKFYKYVANTTYKGLDFCAGGNTRKEAENILKNYLIK